MEPDRQVGMMDEKQENVRADEFPKGIIRQARQGWKKQFDKALHVADDDNAEQQEWMNAPLTDDEDWHW